MTKFLNILNKRFTIGNLLTIIASFIFAIIVRQAYLFLFGYLPTKGEIELLDISFFGIVMLFKHIFSACLEYLQNENFSTPLYESIGTGVKQKELDATTLKMVDRDNQGSSSSVEKSPEGKSTLSEQDRDYVRKLIAEKGIRTNDDFID